MIQTKIPAVVVLALGAGMLLAACGDETTGGAASGDEPTFGPAPSPSPQDANLVDPGYTGRFQAVATVLESPEHGPQLCDSVQDSYPPQCGGPDIVGWDWATAEGEESASGTTWGTFIVTGTWDSASLTLTEPPRANDGSIGSSAYDPDFTSPCPEPEGGWRPVDPSKTTEEDQAAAFARAAASDEYAGGWLDQTFPDGPTAMPDGASAEDRTHDTERLVLNFRFTANLAAHEREIREVWGGALCISAAHRTEADLLDIQERLHTDFPQITSSGHDVVRNVLTAGSWVATTAMQAHLDARYGTGAVILHAFLQPID